MSAERELIESWKYIPKLQHQASLQGNTLEEQARWLGSLIDSQTSAGGGSAEEYQEELLAELSLLSEIYSVVDFDRMIEVREKFQELFPEHFSQYLKSLESLSWQVSWPGCFECSHFDGKCELGLVPTGAQGGGLLDKRCRSKEVRLKAA